MSHCLTFTKLVFFFLLTFYFWWIYLVIYDDFLRGCFIDFNFYQITTVSSCSYSLINSLFSMQILFFLKDFVELSLRSFLSFGVQTQIVKYNLKKVFNADLKVYAYVEIFKHVKELIYLFISV